MQLFPGELETVHEAGQALQRGEMTCEALLERCLNQIDEWESRVRAWVSIDRDGARLRARQLDAELTSGSWRGPLHGIPIGIKDIIDMTGLPTAAGSAQMGRSIAAEDATVVRKLREAGAILLGKTVTTQFACFDPPPTRNPWNLDHTPGGSSSGSAAAVATGMCLAAIGSQTGGSITRPAAFCGVAGCKPTYGRVSLAGIVPLASSLDHPGPIARCARDLASLLDVIAGHDAADPNSAAGQEPIGVPDFQAAIASPPTLARLGGFFDTAPSSAMRAGMETALVRLRTHGATVVESDLPTSFADVHRQHRVIFQYEFAARHRQRFRELREDYLPGVASLLEEGLAVPESAYREAKKHQARAAGEVGTLFHDADIAICPAALGPAPDCSTTGDPAFNSPWSYTGLPTVTIPIALTEEGLPIGIQLVGPRFGERQLFQAALWCEAALRNP